MTNEELKNSHDLDLQCRELGLHKSNAVLIAPNGIELSIVSCAPHLDELEVRVNGNLSKVSVRRIVYNLLNGKGSVR